MQKIKLVVVVVVVCVLTPEIFCYNAMLKSASIRKTLAWQYHHLQKKYNDLTTYCNSIQCVAKSLYFLSLFDEQHYCFTMCDCIDDKTCIQIDTTRFFNSEITSCIQKIWITQSLKPIITLLQKN